MTDSDDTATDSIAADADAGPGETVRRTIEARTGTDPLRIARSARERLESGDPAAGLLLTALSFEGIVYALARYVPEYLGRLGAGPLAIGLFGTVALALPALAGFLEAGRADGTTAVAVPVVAAVGLLTWLVAPTIGSSVGLPAWVVVLVGVLPLGALAFGRETPLAPWPGSVSTAAGRADGFGGLAAAGGVLILACLVMATGSVGAAFRVVLALGAALGVGLGVLRWAAPDAEGDPSEADAGDESSSGPRLPDWRSVLGGLASLPSGYRALLVGDLFLRVATGLVSVFTILVVTRVLSVQVSVLGLTLGPSVVFGGLVAVELLVAGAARAAVRRTGGRFGADSRLLLAGFVTALFPLALVSAPATGWVVAALFGLYGLRDIATAPLTAHLDDALAALPVDPDGYRRLRDLLVAPSALVGGLLYAGGPVLAFGVATAVGSVALREFMQFSVAADAPTRTTAD
ncbi:hypothetical protein ACOZ4N_07155 [Halorientalis pallida]|uniref:hypothetical protein n=1 Tax=Halorientalis pallida TaxID=2479928 RepID=UPI003C6F22A7